MTPESDMKSDIATDAQRADRARRALKASARELSQRRESVAEVPEASPPSRRRSQLCIGMSTYDDFDGVWFSVVAARMLHPEIDLSFVVIDNHPEGSAAPALKALEDEIPGYRYVPFRSIRSTAVRDLVFREADSDLVLCIDSHVLLRAGGLAALVEHLADPACRDLVQGPMLGADGTRVAATHMEPTWSKAMFGTWGHDKRADDPTAPAFDIGSQGLGLFACRASAWPGLNPRFRSFGGEEGYLQEKVRQAGGRTVCLPALGWVHRFARPNGVPHTITHRDRIRNYVLGWREIGWDLQPMIDQFDALYDPDPVDGTEPAADPGPDPEVVAAIREADAPLARFDALVCVNHGLDHQAWADARSRLLELDVAWLQERAPVAAAGRAVAWRDAVTASQHRGHQRILLLDDRAVLTDAAVREAVAAFDAPDLGPLGARRLRAVTAAAGVAADADAGVPLAAVVDVTDPATVAALAARLGDPARSVADALDPSAG